MRISKCGKSPAREEAKKADEMIAAGKSLPLTGIPLAIKDNMLDRRAACRAAASKMLENYRASYDATVITKAEKRRVRCSLGRTNMDDSAMGSFPTENSAYSPTKNPRDTVARAGRLFGRLGSGCCKVISRFAALGTDTGGSIRQPGGAHRYRRIDSRHTAKYRVPV